MLRGSHGDVSGFQTIATCRDGLKNSRDKSATSPFASRKQGNRRHDVADKSTATSRVCREEVGIMEFELKRRRFTERRKH